MARISSRKQLELHTVRQAIRTVYPGGNVRIVAYGRIAIDDFGSLSLEQAMQWLADRNCRIEQDPMNNHLQVVRILGEID